MLRACFFFLLLMGTLQSGAQTWVDSLDAYVRESFLPARKYKWLWTHSALLNTMMKQHGKNSGNQAATYLEYIQKAMDRTKGFANGRTPNDVASAQGMAYLYKITGDKKYLEIAEQVYREYLKIRRTKEGAVSHLMLFTELWDDTVFMIGEFLLQMYQATGDEKYLQELAVQIRLHREKLMIPGKGLWVHGWDSDRKKHCTFCSQMNWADPQTRRSSEAWGRGNGWVVVTLSDALEVLPKSSPLYAEWSGYLLEMVQPLPAYQDSVTGHWYQLPLRAGEPGNWIESSCTAMFAYGIQTALDLGLLQGEPYRQSVRRAYSGLRTYSLFNNENKYLCSKNVCTATCIGDKEYYYRRGKKTASSYGIGMMIQLGRKVESSMK